MGSLIFDEVDTGVSGRAAAKVAEKMSRLSRTCQVLCVTHLAQIAAMADSHYSVHKEERGGRTYTQVEDLDRQGRKEELARLTQQAFLTPAQAQTVDPQAVAHFFASDLGREVLAAETLHREYPFSVLAPAEKFFPQTPAGEEVLLQGVVDCWFETEAGITIVDFKTDRVSSQQAMETEASITRGRWRPMPMPCSGDGQAGDPADPLVPLPGAGPLLAVSGKR